MTFEQFVLWWNSTYTTYNDEDIEHIVNDVKIQQSNQLVNATPNISTKFDLAVTRSWRVETICVASIKSSIQISIVVRQSMWKIGVDQCSIIGRQKNSVMWRRSISHKALFFAQIYCPHSTSPDFLSVLEVSDKSNCKYVVNLRSKVVTIALSLSIFLPVDLRLRLVVLRRSKI